MAQLILRVINLYFWYSSNLAILKKMGFGSGDLTTPNTFRAQGAACNLLVQSCGKPAIFVPAKIPASFPSAVFICPFGGTCIILAFVSLRLLAGTAISVYKIVQMKFLSALAVYLYRPLSFGISNNGRIFFGVGLVPSRYKPNAPYMANAEGFWLGSGKSCP